MNRRAPSGLEDRAYLRGRIAVALNLAIRGSYVEANQILTELECEVGTVDYDTATRYYSAWAITHFKARSVDSCYKAFDRALSAARASRDPRLIKQALGSYGLALSDDGEIGHAIELLEEALAINCRQLRRSQLVNLAEALFAGGQLQRSAKLLHEFHTINSTSPHAELLLTSAATGIPAGIMARDKTLLRRSCDPALLGLAFSQPRQGHLLGQIAEAFCFLYEHQDRRAEHDALLERALNLLQGLSFSVAFAVRAARLGKPHQIPRVQRLMSHHFSADTALSRPSRALFDSFIASRHGLAHRAKRLAMQAANDFAIAGRPFAQAVALDAAGLHDAANALRRSKGASFYAIQSTWAGTPLRRGMAMQLTAREREVAQLAGHGLTDRAIAAKLGLSDRTVQAHCRAVLGKLGIRSRWQLSNAGY